MQMLLSKINNSEYFILYPAQRFPIKLEYQFSRNLEPDTIHMILASIQRDFHVVCLLFSPEFSLGRKKYQHFCELKVE